VVERPVRIAVILVGLVALAAPPIVARAQDGGRVSEAALTVPGLRADDGAVTTVRPRPEKKQKQVSHKANKTANNKGDARQAAAVPRTTFEDRTGHYFDPLSLTLAPDTRLDPVKSQYDQVTDSFVPPDKALVAATPDDSAATQISSASIEQMGKGNNHTVVVPLFQILNSLSPGPAPQ
jgi:hypothetical protein